MQENNTMAVRWLINVLPVPLRLQNQGNTSKKPFRGLVQAQIWNLGLSKQELDKQNNCPFNGVLEQREGEKRECQRGC